MSKGIQENPANANSPANISPVGPPPVITTACSVIATLRPDTSRTTHAFRYSHFRRFSLRPALCGTTRGLTQAPRFAIYWKWKGVGTLLSTFRPLWADNLLAKRRRTAVRRHLVTLRPLLRNESHC